MSVLQIDADLLLLPASELQARDWFALPNGGLFVYVIAIRRPGVSIWGVFAAADGDRTECPTIDIAEYSRLFVVRPRGE